MDSATVLHEKLCRTRFERTGIAMYPGSSKRVPVIAGCPVPPYTGSVRQTNLPVVALQSVRFVPLAQAYTRTDKQVGAWQWLFRAANVPALGSTSFFTRHSIIMFIFVDILLTFAWYPGTMYAAPSCCP